MYRGIIKRVAVIAMAIIFVFQIPTGNGWANMEDASTPDSYVGEDAESVSSGSENIWLFGHCSRIFPKYFISRKRCCRLA